MKKAVVFLLFASLLVLAVAGVASANDGANPADVTDSTVAQVAHWQAMAALTDGFDYAAAADVQAARWQAMAAFYDQAGMLNSVDGVFPEVASAR